MPIDEQNIDYWERERRKKIRQQKKKTHFNTWMPSLSATSLSSQDATMADGPGDHPDTKPAPVYAFLGRNQSPHNTNSRRKTPAEQAMAEDMDNFINSRPGFMLIDQEDHDYNEQYYYSST